jgi:hypothetical protein
MFRAADESDRMGARRRCYTDESGWFGSGGHEGEEKEVKVGGGRREVGLVCC